MARETIDCHVHPMRSAQDSGVWFPKSTRIASEQEFVDRLRAAGVTRACGPVIGQGPEDKDFRATAELNETALRFRDRFPDFYLPAVQLDVRFGEDSCRELRRYYEREGVRWAGELVLYEYTSDDLYTSAAALGIYQAAAELAVPVNFHSNRLDQIEAMCQAVPQCTFVLAHPRSSKEIFLQRIALVARHRNLYLDLSGAGLERYGLLREGIAQAGAEKLLFGSDFPICHPAAFLAAIDHEHLTAAQLELILAGNFKRLTGLT
jgi:predicted TIM-barrel fold metal-dependent hydrolase